MEDSTEFLKMAGSILLFVVALSVIIPLFSLARQTCDSLIAYSDRESEFYNGFAYLDGTEGEDKYFYNGMETTDPANKVRSVGLDTIIPAIYRSYDENYRIVFMKGNVSTDDPGTNAFFNGLQPYYFYRRRNNEGLWEDSNTFDLNDFSIAKENVNEFIEAFLYAKFKKYSQPGTPQIGFQTTYSIQFDKSFADGTINVIHNSSSEPYTTGKGLYDSLKEHLESGKEILEYIGLYYLEDIEKLEELDTSNPGAIIENTDITPESMKDEKRLITYVLKTN